MAKLAGKKQNVLLPRWLNEETLFPKTNELRMRAMINVRGKIEVREKHGVQPTKSQKIATLCMIIACLDDEGKGEGIRKKDPDRGWLRRRAERGS